MRNLTLMDAGFLKAPPPAGVSDPLFSDVMFLLQAEGEDGSSSIADYGPLGCAVYMTSTATVSTEQSFLGGRSFKVDNGRLFLNLPAGVNAIGTGEYTLEARVHYVSKVGAEGRMWSSGGPGTSANLAIGFGGFNNMTVVIEGVAHIINAGNIVANQFRHFAVCRGPDGRMRFFDNGVQKGVTPIRPTLDLSSSAFVFGDANSVNMKLYIDDIRCTRRARYVSNFIPSPQRFPRY